MLDGMRTNNASFTRLSTSPGGRRVRCLSGKLQHAAGGGHDQGRWHSLARRVPHHEAQPILGEEVEVVKVAPSLPSWLVVGRDLPALQCGHFLRERGLLDAPCHPKLLLDALSFDPLLFEVLLPKWREVRFVPLFHDLAFDHAVDDDGLYCYAHTAGREPLIFFLIVGIATDEPSNYLDAFGDLLLDAEVEVGRSV